MAKAGEIRYRDAQTFSLKAMALHQLQKPDQARVALAKASDIVERTLPPPDSHYLGPAWHDVLIAHILLREAKALIEGGAASDGKR